MAGKSLPIFCPQCHRTGNPNSQMFEEIHSPGVKANQDGGMMTICASGHRFRYEALLALKPRMVKPTLIEKQPKDSLSVQFWIHPIALETLRQRYPQNLMTTMYAILVHVADPDTVIITGEDARQLRSQGKIERSRDVLGLAERLSTAERQLEQYKIREAALAPIFAMMKQAGLGVVPPPTQQPAQGTTQGGHFIVPGQQAAPVPAGSLTQPAPPANPFAAVAQAMTPPPEHDFLDPNSPNYDAVAAAMYEAEAQVQGSDPEVTFERMDQTGPQLSSIGYKAHS